jgi:hypothetical protein
MGGVVAARDGTALLAWAFVTEPAQPQPYRPRTKYGIFAMAAGVGIHLLAGRRLAAQRKAGDR